MTPLAMRNMSEPVARLGVVIPAYNHRSDLAACLKSLKENTTVALDIVVVDNASTDDTVDFIEREYPEITLIRELKNTG